MLGFVALLATFVELWDPYDTLIPRDKHKMPRLFAPIAVVLRPGLGCRLYMFPWVTKWRWYQEMELLFANFLELQDASWTFLSS